MIIDRLAKELNIKASQIEKTVELIDQGNTIPFIARYRKEMTGGLSDVTLRIIDERLTYIRNLEKRKEEVIRLIDEQGKLTEQIKESIFSAEVLQKVEDLYRPFKQKKRTRASVAREKGLEPLAQMMLDQEIEKGNLTSFCEKYINEEKGVRDADEAIKGAMDIVAEVFSDHSQYREDIRNSCMKKGFIVTEAVDDKEESVYEMYYDYSESLVKVPPHRILAINRGEKEKKLKVRLSTPDQEILDKLSKQIIKNPRSIFASYLEETIQDAYKRLILPSIERDIRNSLSEKAEKDAVKVFAQNTEKLLMAPPLNNVRVMAVDPGFRTGCKVAVLDETGKLMAYTAIFPHGPQNDVVKARKVTKDLLEKFAVDIIAIGNGTASRETEQFIADTIKEINNEIHYTLVSEAGASVYSASKLATEEYPDLDVTTRGALSIGRRLQDPLAELVKIDPKHIGVGQYQHDINQGMLNDSLKKVVEDCVNRVGVDLNTASPSLLKYISGINASIANNIVDYREKNGKFKSRKELKKVSKLGEKAFEQCAGFLRIIDGELALDSTAVHPESYDVANRLMVLLGIHEENIKNGGTQHIEEMILNFNASDSFSLLKQEARMKNNIARIAEELSVGIPTLEDIIIEFKKPGRDPREDMPGIILRNDVLKFEDLQLGMELTGTVRNVVDFGAFVDIGIKDDGLVHISQISDKYIKHPSDVINVGDVVKVRIMDIHQGKGRVSLTMKGL